MAYGSTIDYGERSGVRLQGSFMWYLPDLYKMKFGPESTHDLTAQKKLQNTSCCLNNSSSSLVSQI